MKLEKIMIGNPEDLFKVNGEYKIVQFIVKDNKNKKSLLVVGERNKLHANIALNFLRLNEISFKFNEKISGPYIKGKNYEIVGAGLMTVLPKYKIMTFAGGSKGYAIGIDRNHLIEYFKSDREFQDWDIKLSGNKILI